MKKILLAIPVAIVGCATPPVEVMPDTIDEIIPETKKTLHVEEYFAEKEKALEKAKIKKRANKMKPYRGHGTTYTQGYYHSYDSFHRNYYYKNGISPH